MSDGKEANSKEYVYVKLIHNKPVVRQDCDKKDGEDICNVEDKLAEAVGNN